MYVNVRFWRKPDIQNVILSDTLCRQKESLARRLVYLIQLKRKIL